MRIIFDEKEMVQLKHNDYVWKVKKQEIADFLVKESNTSKLSLIERYFILGYLPMIKSINVIDIEAALIEVDQPTSIKMEIRQELIKFFESKK